jgi:hypothetical protein
MLRSVGLFLLVAGSAFACRCVEPPVGTAYKGASTVTMVKVLSTSPGSTPTGTVIEAAVSASWKHPVSGTIKISTDTDCAYPVKVGGEYLLFLVQDQAGGYSTGLCMGNLAKASSGKAVSWLRKNGSTNNSR